MYRRWSSIGIDGNAVSVRIRTPMPNPQLVPMIERLLAGNKSIGSIDVQYTGPVLALPLREASATDDRMLRIGSSISLANTRTGTLGFFAKCRETGEIGLVSANHVIAGQDRARPGDAILAPGGSGFGMRVASFVRSVPLGGAGEKYVDCAFARLETDRFNPSLLPGKRQLQAKPPATLRPGESVFKFSEESGETRGIVKIVDQDNFKMHYRSGIGLVMFDNQIEVESPDADRRFSATGDSGALVYNDDLRPVGLLFAHTLSGGTHDNGLSYVNPIDEVLHRLNVEILV